MRFGIYFLCMAALALAGAVALGGAAWLLYTGRAADPDQALAHLRSHRPGIRLQTTQRAFLDHIKPARP